MKTWKQLYNEIYKELIIFKQELFSISYAETELYQILKILLKEK